jgi:hypothetical protein
VVAKVKWPLIAVLTAVGLVWVGQGIGLIEGSFMTGQPFWAIVGAALLAVAIVLAISPRRGG